MDVSNVAFYHGKINEYIVVSQEDFTLTAMRQFVPSLFRGLTEAFTGDIVSDEPVQFTRDQKKFLELISTMNYATASNLSVYVPEGMIATYLTYLDALLPAVLHCQNRLQDHLSAYNKYLSVLINVKDAQLTFQDQSMHFKRMETERREIANAMDKCFNMDKAQSEVKYGSVLSRNADWPAVFRSILEISDLTNNIERTQIKKKIASIVEMMNVIQKKTDEAVYDNITSETISGISEGAYQVAKEVEFYSVVHYRVLALVQAVTDSIEKLTRNLSR